MSLDAKVVKTLTDVSTATITTILLKKGLRNVWMRGTQPLRPNQKRVVGPAFTLRFVPADFAASFRGRPVAAPTVRFSDVQYLGLLISDKQSGAFKVDLKGIRAE